MQSLVIADLSESGGLDVQLLWRRPLAWATLLPFLPIQVIPQCSIDDLRLLIFSTRPMISFDLLFPLQVSTRTWLSDSRITLWSWRDFAREAASWRPMASATNGVLAKIRCDRAVSIPPFSFLQTIPTNPIPDVLSKATSEFIFTNGGLGGLQKLLVVWFSPLVRVLSLVCCLGMLLTNSEVRIFTL